MPDALVDPAVPGDKPTPPPTTSFHGAARTITLAVTGGLALFVVSAIVLDTGLLGLDRDSEKPTAPADAVSFKPPPMSALPKGSEGEAIMRGMQIFMNPGANATQFVGNNLSCANCHLDAGRRANSAPMWAAWVAYPKYRSKNKQINTMEDRVKGCFTYSMNAQGSPSGGPPPKGDQVYKDLEIYFHWLATNAPTGVDMSGAGYPKIKLTDAGYDPGRGVRVFAQNCAACHGSDGQGQRDLNGRIVFPPLWGSRSYNWGAGMARVDNAAYFIKANMPLGQSNRLSDQQAWDVAAYINSRERPKDPRQTGTVAQAAAEDHAGEKSYYGKMLDGHLLGTGTGDGERKGSGTVRRVADSAP